MQFPALVMHQMRYSIDNRSRRLQRLLVLLQTINISWRNMSYSEAMSSVIQFPALVMLQMRYSIDNRSRRLQRLLALLQTINIDYTLYSTGCPHVAVGYRILTFHNAYR